MTKHTSQQALADGSAGSNADEIERIKVALDALLTEMLRQDDAVRKGASSGKPIVVCAADVEPVTRRQGQIDALLRHPVRAACRNAIRLLGERLHELGLDLDQMQHVAEWAACKRIRHFSKRINIIDKAWDGIGQWVA